MRKMQKMLVVLTALILLTACEKVPAGNVGVKVYLLGTSKGVESEELGVGRYWIGFNEELYLFPTFTQNYVWTQSEAEGSLNDESFSFQTVEGLTVGADIGVSYHIDPTKVNTIFQKYRRGIDEITDVFLRNMVRDALVTESSVLPIQNVYGKGKAELIAGVQKRVEDQVSEIGIVIERIYWIGNLRLPDSVVAAIDAKIGATQKAQQRRNEVEQATAEADKAIEEARGVAESKIKIAEADAKAIRLKGAALRENPEVLTLVSIEKWDGVLPRLMGGSGAIPFINVGQETDQKILK